MIQFTTYEKYAIVSVLTQIMNADGIVDPKEEEFMDNFFAEQDIKIADLENCRSMDELISQQIVMQMSVEKLKYAHSLFLSMAEIDGYLHPKEQAIINRLIKMAKMTKGISPYYSF